MIRKKTEILIRVVAWLLFFGGFFGLLGGAGTFPEYSVWFRHAVRLPRKEMIPRIVATDAMRDMSQEFLRECHHRVLWASFVMLTGGLLLAIDRPTKRNPNKSSEPTS